MSPWATQPKEGKSKKPKKGAPKKKEKTEGEPAPWKNLFAGLPKSFSTIRTEPSFGENEITFCIWWSRDDEMKWRVGDDLVFPGGNDPDGSQELLAHLDGRAATYAKWASEYVERKVPLAIVKKVFAHKPLTDADVRAFNPDATLDDVREELASLGYKIAEKIEKTHAIAHDTSHAVTPIGIVRSSRKKVVDDDWDAVTSRIELDRESFDGDALLGLDTFSHAEIVYVFDRVEVATIERGARHPRNNEEWPRVGIFAQRGKNRPNRIGVTVCKVLRVEGNVLHVAGLDAVDGTPVLDVKPWVKEFGPRGSVKQPGWMSALMKKYWG